MNHFKHAKTWNIFIPGMENWFEKTLAFRFVKNPKASKVHILGFFLFVLQFMIQIKVNFIFSRNFGVLTSRDSLSKNDVTRKRCVVYRMLFDGS